MEATYDRPSEESVAVEVGHGWQAWNVAQTTDVPPASSAAQVTNMPRGAAIGVMAGRQCVVG